jgi:hypothetical protein
MIESACAASQSPRATGSRAKSSRSPRTALAFGAAVWCCSIAGVASATPRPLPFTYSPQTLPAGALELEQYVDATPVRVARENAADTTAVTSLRFRLESELEYGLTDSVEVAWYFVFEQAASPGVPALRFQGVKQRVRFQLAERGEWPVDLGVYLEVAEFHNEVEFEEKVLLGKRFGRFDLNANLWVEQEYYFQENAWKFVYNPSIGVAFEASPHFSVGLEYWARGRFDRGSGAEAAESPSRTRHYLGPTLMGQAGEYFLSLGAYARMDRLSKAQPVDDGWGKLWFRALLGIGL